jgi:hypothetical protein
MATLSSLIQNYTSTETLDSVADRGATTNQSLTMGNLTSTGIDDNAVSTAITIDSSQDVTFTSDAKFPDNGKAIFGAGSDLEIYHNATDSVIADVGTGNLKILANDLRINNADSSKSYITGFNGAQVYLYHNGSPKLETTSTGIDVTGDVNSDSLTTGTFTSTGIDDNATSTAITIDSSENVGIGTTSPDGKLNVFSASAGSVSADADADELVLENSGNVGLSLLTASTGESGIYFGNPGTGGQKDFYLKYYHESHATTANRRAFTFNTASTERMRIDSSGKVGIGTTSPLRNLQIGDHSGAQQALSIQASTTGKSDIFLGDGTGSGEYAGLVRYDHASDFMALWTASTERMRIDSSGNVGIGTTSTTFRFNVSSSSSTSTNLTSTSGTSNLRLTNSGGLATLGSTGNELHFTTSLTERMRIDGSGNLLVNSTSAGALATSGRGLIDVDGTSDSAIELKAGGSTYGYLYTSSSQFRVANLTANPVTFFTNNIERMRIDGSGDLLVGTTVATVNTTNFGTRISSTAAGYLASYRDVSGTAIAVLFGGNAGQVYVRGDGDLENTNNNYGAISDERLKSDIVDASSQIDDIMAVQVRSYTLNETGDTHIGVVAQELEASGMSGLVKTDDEGMKSVKYSILYMKAIKALQEAVTRIETLETEVAALKGE